MWWKKKVPEVKEQPKQPEVERKLLIAICDSLTALEKRMASVEIEIDVLKIRWKKKLIEMPEAEVQPKDINKPDYLAIG